MKPIDDVEPQLNDAIEGALITIFTHLYAEDTEVPQEVLDATEDVELWARQRHCPWSQASSTHAESARSWNVQGLAGFVFGLFSATGFFLPEILGLTCR